MEVVEARGVSKVYGGTAAAVTGVNLTIRRGERVAVIGPNGAGKSTLVKILNLTASPTSGQVLWNGLDVSNLRAGELRGIRSRIATIHQQYHLVPQLSAHVNVLSGKFGRWSLQKSLWAVASRAELSKVYAILAEVGLSELLYERCDRLSGGEQQRVAIARALFQEPDLLLADEPLAALDPTGAADLLELLLSRDSDRAILLCSHDLGMVLERFPRVIGIKRGGVHFDLPSGDVTPALLTSLFA